ncbi:MAG: SulP family inorganic anion transporter [Gammaproteobacteria bacterium]|nr:SulP family inorganic anion transporter [Gammaproteobacteria bacterium]
MTRDSVRVDALAGLTGAIVVLPQGIAFAAIAGMPPEFGLYAAMIPAIIAAFFGSSPQLVSGPTTAASIVLFSSLSAMAVPGSAQYVQLALTLTLMVGIIELVMGLARLGLLVNFISHSVIIGFTGGAAILIAVNQLKHLLGVEAPSGILFLEILILIGEQAAQTHWPSVFVGLLTVGAAVISKRIAPRMPYMLVAIVVGTLAATVINFFGWYGSREIATVGEIPATLPPLSMPDFSPQTIKELAPAAMAVTLFALAEAISISRALAARTGHYIDGNQEFIGQGLSNIVGSFVSSYVATGLFNRSAVNHEAGARTPLAAIISGALLIVIVIVVAPLLTYLPNAAMAGILFVIAWNLLDTKTMVKITRTSRSEALVLWATFLSTLFLELEFAIFLGVLLSLGIFLSQASRPSVQLRAPDHRLPKHRFNTDPDLPQCPQVQMVRINGPIFFGAANYVAGQLRRLSRRSPGQRHLLLLARSINFVDVAGAELLANEARARRARGGGMYLHQLKEAAVEPLRRGGYLDDIGEENLYESKSEAISGIFAKLDRSICARCEQRIFSECQDVPFEGSDKA